MEGWEQKRRYWLKMEGKKQGGMSGQSLPASEQARGGLGGPSLGV